MRNSQTVGGYVCPETYHGTRMDEKALEFHTQLHEWSEAQKISAQANRHAQLLANARNKDVYLPFKKLAQIEHWTKDVNKFYRPNKGNRPKSGNFMKIDVTKYNMKVDSKPEETRSKSAVYSTTVKGKGYRILSAVSTSTSATRRRFFGTDVHTINTNLIESQIHYSAQRRDIRSATIRRPQTAKTVDTKVDTDANLSVNINGLDKVEPSESETLSTLGNSSTKHSSVDSQGQSQGQGQTDADVLQQKITARSWSNRMLNVISIDDCKLTCRYRPQTIKESQGNVFNGDLDQPVDNSQVTKDEDNKETLDSNKKATSESSELGEDDSEIKLDVRLNGMLIGDISRDNNNNVDDTTDPPSEDGSSSGSDEENDESVADDDDADKPPNKKKNITKFKKKKKTKRASITFDEKTTTNCSNGSKTGSKNGKKSNSSSSQTNKTSYGRITSLYTHSQSDKPKDKENKKKKVTRTAKLNNAINDMVKDRRVMNSMERDFDTRTAQFGRTVVDKSEGSVMFQKLHSNLRKKMDTFIDTHSAVKTHKFYETKRKNSLQSQN